MPEERIAHWNAETRRLIVQASAIYVSARMYEDVYYAQVTKTEARKIVKQHGSYLTTDIVDGELFLDVPSWEPEADDA